MVAPRQILSDFQSFLLKQNVIGLAVAVVVGNAMAAVVKGAVDDFIMPVILAVTPGETWQTFTINLGPVRLGIGHFIAAVINFIILALVAWRIARIFIKAEPTHAMRDCPFCLTSINAAATRCAHCTSEQEKA